jgi:hypothetical protein
VLAAFVVVGASVCCALSLATVAGAAGSSTSTSTSTTTTMPLTLAEWKQHYESTIGTIALDVVAVVKTGAKEAEHPTKKSYKTALSSCERLLHDATQLPSTVPTIPLASAQRNWQELARASSSAASDCLATLEQGSKAAAGKLHHELPIIEAYEQRLLAEMGPSTTATTG